MTVAVRSTNDARNARTATVEKAGFSLIEVMVAMVIVSVLLAAVYAVYASLSRSYTTQNVSAEVQQSIRAAMTLMAEDIMMAGLDPVDSGEFGFDPSGSTSISFRYDTANSNNEFSGEMATSGAQVTYFFSNETLYQCDNPVTCPETDQNIFIENVTDFRLDYLDSSGNDLFTDLGYADPLTGANLSDIRQVVITIEVEEPAGRDKTVSRTYATRVKCRNAGL